MPLFALEYRLTYQQYQNYFYGTCTFCKTPAGFKASSKLAISALNEEICVLI